MERLWNEINENVLTEDDLISSTKWHNVSVYRKENFQNSESIKFKCSQYRRFTKCQYQLKEKVYHDGHYQIFYSKQHEHQPLENTNLPIQIRPLVRNLALKGLTIAQIKETMKVLHPHISIDTKIRNIVQYEQRINLMNISSEMLKDDNDIYRWYADTIVYRVFGPLIACLGIVGGTLSCLVFRRKALRKKSCSIYFLFLALADLLCMICWLVHFVFPTYNIQVLTLSNIFCKIFVFSMYFAFDLANYILTACSIDRAVSVLFPVGSRKYCRRRIAYTITLILVLIDTLLNSHLLYGFVVLSAKSTLNISIPICHHRFDSAKYQKLFSAYDSYVDIIKTNVIPFIIMSICNLIIIIRVCRSNSFNQGKTHLRRTKSKRKYEKDRQLTLMLLGSSIAFLVLTIPTEINDIIRSNSTEKIVTEKTYLLSAILLSLAHLNYAIHFYIYTLTGEVFRQQLIKLWPINLITVLFNSSSTNQTIINPTRQFQINLNCQIDQSEIQTKTKINNQDEISF